MYTSLQKDEAVSWFSGLQERICQTLETVERSDVPPDHEGTIHAPQQFIAKEWQREGGGGGQMRVLRDGRVFEKAGVNVSTVHGTFSEAFRQQIAGAAETGKFWASGISLVLHPRSPFVPAVHMNTRMIITTQGWFGGGIDLTPMGYARNEETQELHGALEACCKRHPQVADYPEFKAHCDRYFYLPHRGAPRGVGGIFYDNLNTGQWQKDFDFTRDLGETFLNLYPQLVEARLSEGWTQEHRTLQLKARSRYVEFNLLYDRGTKFGLMTGGNTEAILMSLPPVVTW